MMQPGRSYSAGSAYRYGFNGKELDKESPVQYDYGFRIYDPRLGRFKSVDPLTKSYPQLTPYQFASNSAIANVDMDGKESEYYTLTITYTTVHRTQSNGDVTATTSSSSSLSSEKKDGYLWGLIPNNGPLGTGTLYTVQTKTVDIFENANGLPLPTEEVGKTNIIGMVYKPSEADEKLMNKNIDRPQFNGSTQIMIFGYGNGMYPGDQTGSKPNPNAKTTISIDMREWDEIFEPVLLGMDVKMPEGVEAPEISEIFGNELDKTVSKYKDVVEKIEKMPDPGVSYCDVCKSKFRKNNDGSVSWDTTGVKNKVPVDSTKSHGQKPDRKTKINNEHN